MLKPICIPCKRFFRQKKSGYYFIEGMPLGNDAAPGMRDPGRWKPYKIWSGDLWECPDCHAQIISGTDQSPISEHYKADFADMVDRLNAGQMQVNDC